jgi:AcrR family transcriptional regulator
LEFDEHDALTAAMHAFRRLGYRGVSIKTLEAETGLSSGSIYNSFGGKDAIFERSLSHYNEVVVAKRIERYLDPERPIDGLVALFNSLLEEPENGAFGCLLTNSAIELAGADTAATTEIKRGFDRFLAAFKDVLSGLPGVDSDGVEIKSLRLLAYYQGLLVLIRHGHDKAKLRSSIKSEILSITGETNV